jgi:serine protease AprX
MKVRPVILTLLFLLVSGYLSDIFAQSSVDESDLYYYRIYFTDKGASPGDFTAAHVLSPAAISRREKYGIEALSTSDLPVNSQYLGEVSQHGLIFKCASKWMNTAVFTSPSPVNITELGELDFVTEVQLVKHPAEPVKHSYSKYGITGPVDTEDEFDPRVPLNGTILHQSGFTGRGVTIAVLDAGFVNVDVIESLMPLRQRGGITATHDFVSGSDYVYDYHTHGTSVLSILAGNLPGLIHGTAPGADYILLRSEDATTEYPVEEDYWAAAAEYADSAGADVISSSLGYFTFDDPLMDYSYSDMDGNTAFVTRAADMAASKGILVVVSAGNERNKEWLRIIAPSDGNSVVGVGAVNQDLSISAFSSAGYSADERVKPDVVAPGVNLTIQFEPGMWHSGSGTSFSCPVISGLSASLMQAVPTASPTEIISSLQKSSDRYNNPDTLYGYGLPDFLKALRLLEDIKSYIPEETITAGPNPFTDEILLWFHDKPGGLSVTVTATDGRCVLKRNFPVFAGRSYRLDGLDNLSQGVYLVRVTTDIGEKVFKMVRVRQ